MPRRCTICHHPQHEEIAVSLFRDGTRTTASRFQISLPVLDRHKRHLSSTLVDARQAEVVCDATFLLARVESLMVESEKIAAAAQLEKDWPAAIGALREARSCLELLGRLRGEIQSSASLHLHAHSHIHSAPLPRNEAEIERVIAQRVSEATGGFDPAEIARLKMLVEPVAAVSRD